MRGSYERAVRHQVYAEQILAIEDELSDVVRELKLSRSIEQVAEVNRLNQARRALQAAVKALAEAQNEASLQVETLRAIHSLASGSVELVNRSPEAIRRQE